MVDVIDFRIGKLECLGGDRSELRVVHKSII
jgi:hypothetical protein